MGPSRPTPSEAVPQELLDLGSSDAAERYQYAGSGTGQWHYGSDGGGPDSGVGRLHPRCHPTSVTLGAFCRNRLWFQRRSSSSTSFARPPSCRGFALGFNSFRKGEFLQCRVRGRDSFSKAGKAKEASEKAWRRRAYNYRKGCSSGKATHLATVSASLEHLMAAIPQLTSQVQHIADRQRS